MFDITGYVSPPMWCVLTAHSASHDHCSLCFSLLTRLLTAHSASHCSLCFSLLTLLLTALDPVLLTLPPLHCVSAWLSFASPCHQDPPPLHTAPLLMTLPPLLYVVSLRLCMVVFPPLHLFGLLMYTMVVYLQAKLQKKCFALRNVISHYHWRLSGRDVSFATMTGANGK